MANLVQFLSPDWRNECMLALSGGTATIAGVFVDANMQVITIDGTTYSYSGSITSVTPVTLLGALSLTGHYTDLAAAVAFVGLLTVANIIAIPGSADGVTVPTNLAADMVANPSRYPVRVADPQALFVMGRAYV